MSNFFIRVLRTQISKCTQHLKFHARNMFKNVKCCVYFDFFGVPGLHVVFKVVNYKVTRIYYPSNITLIKFFFVFAGENQFSSGRLLRRLERTRNRFSFFSAISRFFLARVGWWPRASLFSATYDVISQRIYKEIYILYIKMWMFSNTVKKKRSGVIVLCVSCFLVAVKIFYKAQKKNILYYICILIIVLYTLILMLCV